jgi:hypothetical protein
MGGRCIEGLLEHSKRRVVASEAEYRRFAGIRDKMDGSMIYIDSCADNYDQNHG